MNKKMLGLAVAAVLLMVSCGDSDGTLSEPSGLGTTTSAVSPSTSRSVAPTMTTMLATTLTTIATTTTEPEIVEPARYTPADFDPPLGELKADLLVFDDYGAYWFVDGEFTKIIDGPFQEVIDDGSGGILFQREEWDSRVIWWLPRGAEEPQELLVVEAPSSLILEGFMGEGENRQVVYQRLDPGSPQDAIDTLRIYRPVDGSVQIVAETGWWEAGTIISSIVDGIAVGTSSASASGGYYWFDIARGVPVNSAESFEDGPWGEVVAIHDGRLLSVGTLSNPGGLVTEIGLFQVDKNSNASEPIATFPWDNGYWYPSGLLVIENFAIISRGGFENRMSTVMGPIVVDLATGESFTLPFAANVRPLAS